MGKESSHGSTESMEADLIEWANHLQTDQTWIQLIAIERGLRPDSLMLGMALTYIIGDDVNVFLTYVPKFSACLKKSLSIRLQAELATPAMPEDIRVQLSLLQDRLTGSDWSLPEEYESIKSSWYEFYGWVKTRIKNDSFLRECEREILRIKGMI